MGRYTVNMFDSDSKLSFNNETEFNNFLSMCTVKIEDRFYKGKFWIKNYYWFLYYNERSIETIITDDNDSDAYLIMYKSPYADYDLLFKILTYNNNFLCK